MVKEHYDAAVMLELVAMSVGN